MACFIDRAAERQDSIRIAGAAKAVARVSAFSQARSFGQAWICGSQILHCRVWVAHNQNPDVLAIMTGAKKQGEFDAARCAGRSIVNIQMSRRRVHLPMLSETPWPRQ
jgi:hypothetical protein